MKQVEIVPALKAVRKALFDNEGIIRVLIIITDPETGLEMKRLYSDVHGLAAFFCRTGEFRASYSASGFVTKPNVLFKTNYRDTLRIDIELVPVI